LARQPGRIGLNKIDKCPNFGTIAFGQFWSCGDADPTATVRR
jgi:hypothetical protein